MVSVGKTRDVRLNGVLGLPHVEKGLEIFVRLEDDVGSDEGYVAVAPRHLVAISFNRFRIVEYERVNQQHRGGQLTAEQVVVLRGKELHEARAAGTRDVYDQGVGGRK